MDNIKFSDLVIAHTELWLEWNKVNATALDPKEPWDVRATNCKKSESVLAEIGKVMSRMNSFFTE